MSKLRPSLEAIAQTGTAVVQLAPKAAALELKPARIRNDKPHISVYLDKRVQREVKRIAVDLDRRPHDLYLEAVDLVLRHYGRRSIAEITRDDVTT